MPRYLTKSRFKLGHECPRKLYYTNKAAFENNKANDSFLESLAEGGFQVGELAKLYYPGGHDITESGYDAPLQRTNQLLQQENVIIFEAAIKFENLFIRVDILEKKGNHVKLIEVKAKSYGADTEFVGSKGIKTEWKPYLYDVAFQNFVLKKAFPQFQIDNYLMLADKEKTASVNGLNQKFQLSKNEEGRTSVTLIGDTSPSALGQRVLTQVNVNNLVHQIQNSQEVLVSTEQSFEDNIRELTGAYEDDVLLSNKIGKQCGDCEFKSSTPARSGFYKCWKEQTNLADNELDQPLIFDLWRGLMGSTDIIAPMVKDSVFLLKDITENYYIPKSETDYPYLSPKQRRDLQIEKHKNTDNTPYIDIEGLKAEMNTFKYPLHFIDFETSSVAIPFHEGRRPYEHIAFQYSHHIMHEDGRVEHVGQYLNTEPGVFPNFDFVRALKKELEKDDGTIFRYHNHENTILNKIADQLLTADNPENDKDELLTFINSITNRKDKNRNTIHMGERNMIDLYKMVLNYYYHPRMGGSNSIKAVLPAVLNNSGFIQNKYASPIYGSGLEISSLNFQEPKIWIEHKANGEIESPYKLLPTLFEDEEMDRVDYLFGQDDLADGGAALTAYAKLQFTQMKDEERNKVKEGLLRYCELDTLAMVMIFESWRDSIGN